jgi:hypothetical protein
VKHIISLKIIYDVLPVFLEYALLLLFREYEVGRHTGGQASLIPAVRAVLPVLPVHWAPALLRTDKLTNGFFRLNLQKNYPGLLAYRYQIRICSCSVYYFFQ